MERTRWAKKAMSVEFNSTVVTTISESEDSALIEFGRLKTDSLITGLSINFKKDEIPNLIRLLQDFHEKCY